MAKRLSDAAERKVEELRGRYPDVRSVVMPALYIAQEELGWVTPEAIQWVAERVNLSPVHVMEVATFYTMYYKRPVGRFHFQVCRTLPCALRGARHLVEHLAKRFHLQPGEVSADGRWSYEEVECLGSCGTAPMCEVNDRFFENLTVEKLDKLIDAIEASEPELRLSNITDTLGNGLPNSPKSEVI